MQHLTKPGGDAREHQTDQPPPNTKTQSTATISHIYSTKAYLDVDEVHLFADALHGGLRAERGDVGPHEPVRFPGDRLRVHVVVQLHVPGVDAEDLQPAWCGVAKERRLIPGVIPPCRVVVMSCHVVS